MENRTDILNELQALSPTLAGLTKVNVYSVPSGYFEVLSEDILATLNIEQNGFIADTKQSSGDVPSGYFDQLADHILAKIKQQQTDSAADELRHLSPMLYSIQGENVYTVPYNYFDQLSDELMQKLQPQEAKVVRMERRGFMFMKYAVAAVFTGIVAFSAFKFVGNSGKLDETTKQGLAIAKENKFDSELEKVTDDEIVKYLEADGTDIDDALVATLLDEKDLPTQEDYLTDEKALDNYLDQINLEELKN